MFAKAYDLLMSDVDYEQLYTFIKPYLKQDDTIIDAGCGSGYLLRELLKNHHQVIGIDLDASMLAIAREKLIRDDLSTALYEHDLREPLFIKVDAILMMFDVINYFKGSKRILRNLYHALNRGGKLIFDVYKESVLKEYEYYLEEDSEPFSYRWEIQTKNHHMTHHLVTPFGEDSVKQYVYPMSYYENILNDLGFTYEILNGPDERKNYVIAYKK
ncbi:MAG: class I SAM-dependent methyltransferase [Bacillota bacterium]|nr:MAG: class I SAM-dependent methyltransferase [Bacillota bacterium]